MSNQGTTDWTFNGSWPYEPKWFDSQDGRMHYIDEGPKSGQPVILVHGNPTWGYLYRNFIGPLTEKGYRVIVPDHLGFGRSEKPDNAELYTVPKHAERFETLMKSLNLKNAVLVPHDWGGPISFLWAVRNPDLLKGLFILNTGAYVVRKKEEKPFVLSLISVKGLGEVLVRGLDLFKKCMLFGAGIVKHERITNQIKEAYLAPHPNCSSRTSVLAFPRQIPTEPNHKLADYFEFLEQGLIQFFRKKPVKIMWGLQDIAWRPHVLEEEWHRILPNASVMRIEDAGHYVQEDAYELIVPQLLEFLENSSIQK